MNININEFKDNAKLEILSGLTVSLALMPECIAFAIVAHLSPLVGLYTAAIICLITAILSFCSFSFSLYYGFRESRLSPIHSKVAIFLHASYHPCTLFGIILFALSLSFWFVRFAFFHFLYD